MHTPAGQVVMAWKSRALLRGATNRPQAAACHVFSLARAKQYILYRTYNDLKPYGVHHASKPIACFVYGYTCSISIPATEPGPYLFGAMDPSMVDSSTVYNLMELGSPKTLVAIVSWFNWLAIYTSVIQLNLVPKATFSYDLRCSCFNGAVISIAMDHTNSLKFSVDVPTQQNIGILLYYTYSGWWTCGVYNLYSDFKKIT